MGGSKHPALSRAARRKRRIQRGGPACVLHRASEDDVRRMTLITDANLFPAIAARAGSFGPWPGHDQPTSADAFGLFEDHRGLRCRRNVEKDVGEALVPEQRREI